MGTSAVPDTWPQQCQLLLTDDERKLWIAVYTARIAFLAPEDAGAVADASVTELRRRIPLEAEVTPEPPNDVEVVEERVPRGWLDVRCALLGKEEWRSESAIADELGLRPTAVREALATMQDQGVVENAGGMWRVKELSAVQKHVLEQLDGYETGRYVAEIETGPYSASALDDALMELEHRGLAERGALTGRWYKKVDPL